MEENIKEKIDEKAIQNKYMEYQFLQQQVKQIKDSIQNMDAQLTELDKLSTSLTEFGKLDNEEIFAPLAGGIYVKAKLQDTSKLVVSIGGGSVVEKSVKDTQKVVSSQKEDIEKYKAEMESHLKLLETKFNALQDEITSMVN